MTAVKFLREALAKEKRKVDHYRSVYVGTATQREQDPKATRSALIAYEAACLEKGVIERLLRRARRSRV